MIWFCSDTHFGHKAMVRERRFDSMDAMDAELIKRWNSVVGPRDTIYHLGDFAFANSRRIDEILAQLHGEIHIVLGNHDHRGKVFSKLGKLRFASISPMKEIKPEGTPRITLCHYPMWAWNQSHYGSWHLHGHSHGSSTAPGLLYDVGVDPNDLTPVSIDELHAIMAQRKPNYGDYHKPQIND